MNNYVTTSNTIDDNNVGRFEYDNFITIWGFTRVAFDLKGYELIIYSVIFGYHKATGTAFTGSRKYLESWTGGSRSSVEKALSSLEKKGLIIKEYRKYGTVRKATYRINTVKLPTHDMFLAENINRDVNEKYRNRVKERFYEN